MHVLTALLALALVTAGAAAQEPEPRPRVGLVLSGGGARGIAHIGVLQVLEELRVPVDCVAGTSMGAIVGGLYAYGLSPDELEQRMTSIDWDHLLQDYPSRSDLAIRRKQEEYSFLVQARVGIRDGQIALPKGLIQGQNLGLLLDQLAIEAHDLDSFEELPIPFRCIATDIADGSRIVLERGDLPLAMRASMALPGIFAPVEWEEHLLVDGFLVDNLPVEAARGMGAQRLIAVDIGTPPLEREEIRDLLGITTQMVSILLERNVREAIASLGPEDFLLKPELGDLTVADFERSPELIRIGREWARKHARELARFSVPAEEYERWRSRQRRTPRPMPLLAEVRVETTPLISPKIVEALLRTRPGAPLDLVRLREDLERVYGTDLFEKVRFRLLEQADGRSVLVIQADEKSWGPGYLRFALNASSDFSGQGAFSAGLNYTRTSIGDSGAEWRMRAFLGSETSLAFEWFQPLAVQRTLFVAPVVGYDRFPLQSEINGQVDDIVVDYTGAMLDLGAHVGGWCETRFGLEGAWGEVDIENGPSEHFDDVGLRATVEIDTLDSAMLPSSGVRAVARWRRSFEELGSDADSAVVDLTGYGAATFAEQTLGLLAKVQAESDGETPIQQSFTIGGLFRVSGLGPIVTGGPEGALASLLTYRNVTGPVYLGGSFEAGGVWDGWDTIDSEAVVLGGTVFGAVVTPIGPIYLGYGWAEEGERAAYLVVGQIL